MVVTVSDDGILNSTTYPNISSPAPNIIGKRIDCNVITYTGISLTGTDTAINWRRPRQIRPGIWADMCISQGPMDKTINKLTSLRHTLNITLNWGNLQISRITTFAGQACLTLFCCANFDFLWRWSVRDTFWKVHNDIVSCKQLTHKNVTYTAVHTCNMEMNSC
jgi:hypothetical protein